MQTKDIGYFILGATVCMVSKPIASNITRSQFNWKDTKRTWRLAPCLWKLTMFGQWRAYRRLDSRIHSAGRWKAKGRSPFYHPNRILCRKLKLLFKIHEVNTTKPFSETDSVYVIHVKMPLKYVCSVMSTEAFHLGIREDTIPARSTCLSITWKRLDK